MTAEPIISVGDTLPDGFRSSRSRTGSRCGRTATASGRVRQPRDVARPFPASLTDFTNSLRQPVALDSSRRRARRLPRDPVRGELPALLLELPRRTGAGLRARDPVDERGGDGPRQPHRHRLAGGPERRAGGSGRRVRPAHEPLSAHLQHGPHEPRERRRAAGLPRPRRADGRRHVHGAVLAALPLHRVEQLLPDGRPRRALGFQSSDPNVNDYSDMSGSASISGTSSPSRATSPWATRTCSRTGRTTTSLPVHPRRGHRVRPDTPNVVYFADTGEPRALPGAGAARIRAGRRARPARSRTGGCSGWCSTRRTIPTSSSPVDPDRRRRAGRRRAPRSSS